MACVLRSRAAGRVALDEKQLAKLRSLRGAIGQLARQRRTLNDFLAHDFFRRLQSPLRLADGELRDLVARLGMLIQPQRKIVLDDAGDKRGRLP